MFVASQWVFGPFRLDLDHACLWCEAQALPLSPKVFAVLHYLVTHPDRLVRKDELLDAVWSETAVTDAVVRVAIGTLRKVLGDTVQKPRYIATVPRRGYRFVAEVTEHPGAAFGLTRPATPGALQTPLGMPLEALARVCPRCQHVYSAGTQWCMACAVRLVVRCPSCGRDSQPDAAFCPVCAMALLSPVASPDPQLPSILPLAAERRYLTVLFCDLVDSTRLAERLDPEDFWGVVRSYHQSCAEVIQRFDGYLAQCLGDGVLVYFGYPMVHEDDAQRAVWAGLGIIDTLVSLTTRLPLPTGGRLAVRLGVHTGVVVVGDIGVGARSEPLALRETPTIAVWLHHLAAPNTLVISGATYLLIEGYFTCEVLRAQPLRAYRVLRASGGLGAGLNRHGTGSGVGG
ncbi:MAG: winged helix-turn-helix domain-containing protein [Candidatus Entotheonellia bacterium]